MANVYGLIFEIEDRTKRGTSSINRGLDSINKRANSVKSALGGIGSVAGKAASAFGKTAVAATAAATAFGFLAKKNLDALDALGKTATKLGVSTQFLSEFSFVANQAGLSTDQFQTGLQRFIRRLGQAQQGSGELLKPLKALGINMKDSNGNFREGTEVFQEFLTKLDGTSNNAQKLALAMGAFDTEGVAFINIASLGATEIAKLRREVELAGGSIDSRLTTAAAAANDALGRLALRGKSFGLQFFGSLGAGIESLANDITDAVDAAVGRAGGMEQFAAGLAEDFGMAVAGFIRTLGIMFDGFRNTLNGAVNVLQKIIVGISKIPGSGFDATIGDASTLNAQKAAAQQALEDQQRLFADADAKVQELRGKLADLPSGLFGKNDPDNIAGQLTQAVLESNNLAASLTAAGEQVKNLDNTFVFEQLATDITTATDQTEKMATNIEEVTKKTVGAVTALEAFGGTGPAIKSVAEQVGVAADELEAFGGVGATIPEFPKWTNTRPVKDIKIAIDEASVSLAEFGGAGRWIPKYIDDIRVAATEAAVTLDAFGGKGRFVPEDSPSWLDQMKKDNEKTSNITTFSDFYSSLADNATNAANKITFAAKAQKKLAEQLKAGTISASAFDIAMKETNETLRNSNPYIDNIESAIKGLSGSIASNFTDVIMGLKSGFSALQDIALSVLRTIIQTLVETFIKQQMVAAFGGGGGAGGLGSIMGLGMGTLIPGFGLLAGIGSFLGGLFADGGNTASAGRKPILVGERGPEIFMPGQAGNVVPNEQLNSSGDPLTVNFTLNAIDTQTGVQFLLENKRVITGVIQEAYQRRGAQGPIG